MRALPAQAAFGAAYADRVTTPGDPPPPTEIRPAPAPLRIADETSLRELIPEPPQRAWDKEEDHLDETCRAFLAASPFAVLATSATDGRCDASPRGGPPGFAIALEPKRLALPDYSGNRRQDSNRNILENPHVGLVFFVPGTKETLRVNGRATLSTDPDLCARLASGGAPPKLAIDIAVDVAFVHCGKYAVRSEVWDPSTWPERVSLAANRAKSDGQGGIEGTEARWQASYDDPAQVW
jgi:PPOX class probable FMN-dependent enzyme